MTPDDRATRSEIRKSSGRPRDDRIDDAVIAATRELLAETGYAGLTVAEVASRAGTTKTAIYRRWESKPHLVHDATFAGFSTVVPQSGRIADDLHQMVDQVSAVFGSTVTRAALPGLIADMAANPGVHRRILDGFAGVLGAFHQRLDDARAAGEVRAGVDPTLLIEMLGGAAILATLMRPDDPLDEQWSARAHTLLSALVVENG